MGRSRRDQVGRGFAARAMIGETMLKKTPNFVLVSPKSSTYPRGYASGLGSPAAALDDLFEHRQHVGGHYITAVKVMAYARARLTLIL